MPQCPHSESESPILSNRSNDVNYEEGVCVLMEISVRKKTRYKQTTRPQKQTKTARNRGANNTHERLQNNDANQIEAVPHKPARTHVRYAVEHPAHIAKRSSVGEGIEGGPERSTPATADSSGMRTRSTSSATNKYPTSVRSDLRECPEKERNNERQTKGRIAALHPKSTRWHKSTDQRECSSMKKCYSLSFNSKPDQSYFRKI